MTRFVTDRVLALSERAPTIVALLPAAIIWQLAAVAEVSFAIPPLGDIWSAFGQVRSDPTFTDSVVASLRELGMGLALTLPVGLVVGLLMGLFKLVDEAIGFYVNMFMGAPTAAFVPILINVFGVGSTTIVATVFLFSVFIVTVNTAAGVRGVPPDLVKMGESFGASRWMIVRRIILPGALPMILTGVRLGFGRAIAGMILGEMLVVVVGFGGLIMQKGSGFQVEQLWALIFCVLAFSVVATRLLEALQRRVTAWSAIQGAS